MCFHWHCERASSTLFCFISFLSIFIIRTRSLHPCLVPYWSPLNRGYPPVPSCNRRCQLISHLTPPPANQKPAPRFDARRTIDRHFACRAFSLWHSHQFFPVALRCHSVDNRIVFCLNIFPIYFYFDPFRQHIIVGAVFMLCLSPSKLCQFNDAAWSLLKQMDVTGCRFWISWSFFFIRKLRLNGYFRINELDSS